MKIRLSVEQLQDLAGRLVGSARTLDQALEMIGYTYGQLDDSTLQSIETLVFFCSVCEQWRGIEDLTGDMCFECYRIKCHEDFPPDGEWTPFQEEILGYSIYVNDPVEFESNGQQEESEPRPEADQ